MRVHNVALQERPLSAELREPRADAGGDGGEALGVEAVETDGVPAEDGAQLGLGDAVEGLVHRLARARPGALVVREVRAPHQVTDPDRVPALALAAREEGAAERALARPDLARPQIQPPRPRDPRDFPGVERV